MADIYRPDSSTGLSEQSDARLHVRNDWIAFTETRSRKRRFAVIYSVLTVILSALLFCAYWFFAYAGQPFSELSPVHIKHLLVNVGANVACMIVAYNIRGDLNARLQTGLLVALFAHGALILEILTMREYYSRTVVSLALLSSVGLVTLVALAADRWFPKRIGIVPANLSPEVWQWLPSGAAQIPSVDANERDYDVIVVDWDSIKDRAWMNFVTRALLSGCVVQHVAKYVEDQSGRVSLDHFEPRHARAAVDSTYIKYVKRPLDVLFVLALMPFLLPVLIAAMVAIRLSMGGPVFFFQERVGRGGRPFRIYKLRTMLANNSSTGIATRKGDSRITPIGSFLRRYRIDEIPQLFNVFSGDMSLIGPRPEQPGLAEEYQRSIPGFCYRQLLKPGLTGWAQIRAGYAADSQETRTKLTYDLYYLKHVSLFIDLWIMFDTARAVIKGTSSR